MGSYFGNQIISFVIYLLAGVVISVIFDLFRAIRKTIKTSDITTSIEDIIFWILVLALLIYIIFILGNGSIRFFMIFALIIGCTLYFIIFSKYFLKVSVRILEKKKKICIKVINIICIPIKILLKINKKICCIICINIKNWRKNIEKGVVKEKIKKNKGI